MTDTMVNILQHFEGFITWLTIFLLLSYSAIRIINKYTDKS